MLYKTPPPNFSPTMHVSICYCIYNNKFLLLRKSENNVEEKTWTIPGGKKENNETSAQTICREFYEETRITLNENNLEDLGLYYVKLLSDISYSIQVYKTYLSALPLNIELNKNEHDQYKWVTKEEALTYPLIEDGDTCLLKSFDFKNSKM